MNDKLSFWLDLSCSTHPRVVSLASRNQREGRKTTLNELMKALDDTWKAWYDNELKSGYVIEIEDGRIRRQHVVVAEKALGRPLKDAEMVHHLDEDKQNNSTTNLVICPDQAYHGLLHKRARMLAFSTMKEFDDL